MTNKENSDEKKKDDREWNINHYFIHIGMPGMLSLLLDDPFFPEDQFGDWTERTDIVSPKSNYGKF